MKNNLRILVKGFFTLVYGLLIAGALILTTISVGGGFGKIIQCVVLIAGIIALSFFLGKATEL